MPADTKQGFDTATRVAAGATRTHYDGLAMSLHWLTVVLVLTQFVLSQTWGWFGRPTRHEMIMLHMSFGIVLGAVVIVRIVWRLLPGHHVASVVTGLTDVASKAVHWLLYALLLAQFVSGFVLRWSGKESMSFFGLQIPPMIPAVSRATNDQIGDIHEWMGWAIVIVAAGHAAAALYHHFVVKDRVLVRMLPVKGR